MENNIIEENKKKNLIIGILVFIIIILLFIGVYFIFIKDDKPKEQSGTQDNTQINDGTKENDETGILKSIKLSTSNQEVKIGNNTFKVRIDKMDESDVAGPLYINDEAIMENDDVEVNLHAEFVYYTDDFIIFTSLGQSDNYITYALDSTGKELKIIDQYYQMHDFKFHNDGIVATGAKCCLADGEPYDEAYEQKILIIKHEGNTITIKPLS